jgi:hypothetical protein
MEFPNVGRDLTSALLPDYDSRFVLTRTNSAHGTDSRLTSLAERALSNNQNRNSPCEKIHLLDPAFLIRAF